MVTKNEDDNNDNNNNSNSDIDIISAFSPPKNKKRVSLKPLWLQQQDSSDDDDEVDMDQREDELLGEDSGSDVDWDDVDHVSDTDLEDNRSKIRKKSSSSPITDKKDNKKLKSDKEVSSSKPPKPSKSTSSSIKPFINQKKLIQSTIDVSDWTSKPLKQSSTFSLSSNKDSSFCFERRKDVPINRLPRLNNNTNNTRPNFSSNNKTTTTTKTTTNNKDFFQAFLYSGSQKKNDSKIDELDLLDLSPSLVSQSLKSSSSLSPPPLVNKPSQPKIIPVSIDDGSSDESSSNSSKKEEEEEEEEEEEVAIVNKKRNQNTSLSLTPTKISYFDFKKQKQQKQQHPKPIKYQNDALADILVDLDETTEEEDEEESKVIKMLEEEDGIIKKRSSKSKVLEIQDDDEETEKEDDDSTTTTTTTATTITINDFDTSEDEEEEEEEPQNIDSLIDACERFSKRMVKILSSCDTSKQQEDDKKEEEDEEDDQIFSHQLITQPKSIKMNMRSYQLIGLNWMAIMYKEKINGILADEMGLGKTVQSISLLAHIYESHNDKGPHLIIVPATTLGNWQRELNSWCPTLKIYNYYGTAKEREACRCELRRMKPKVDFNVIITTYNILFSNTDRGFLKKYDYSYLILDEAQNIKNSDSKRYKNIFKIESKHKLLLTGTPLQNNLNELWSLLNFIMPHIFGDKESKFLQELKESNDKGDGDNRESYIISKMKKILSPFILRRLKSEVSHELVPKKEILELLSMNTSQTNHYKAMLALSKTQWENNQNNQQQQSLEKKKRGRPKKTDIDDVDEEDNQIDNDINMDGEMDSKDSKKKGKKGSTHTGALVSNILMQLRKTVNHPLLCRRTYYTEDRVKEIIDLLLKRDKEYVEYLRQEVVEEFEEYSDYDIHCLCKSRQETTHLLDKYIIPSDVILSLSVKCQRTLELIKQHHSSKILIFSQMTKVLDILEEVLDISGIEFARLDGSTPVTERQPLIDIFSSTPSIQVFLLSTLAGGLGINLTCANIVIFFDMSFNPQVDRQAEDRAHRLGQTKEVLVYKLVVGDTVDTYILDLSTNKKQLNDSMLEEGSYNQSSNHLQSKNILKLLHQILDNNK